MLDTTPETGEDLTFVVNENFLLAIKTNKLKDFVEEAKPFIQQHVDRWDENWEKRVTQKEYIEAVKKVKEPNKFVHCSCGEIYLITHPDYKGKGGTCTECKEKLKMSMRKKSNFYTEDNLDSVSKEVTIPSKIPEMLDFMPIPELDKDMSKLDIGIHNLIPSKNSEQCLPKMHGLIKFIKNDDEFKFIETPDIECNYRKVLNMVKSWEEAMSRMLIDTVVFNIVANLNYTIGTNNKTDYSLFYGDNEKLIVEAKAKKEELTSDNFGQLLIYMAKNDVSVGILSNGANYWVVNWVSNEIKYRDFKIMENNNIKEGELQKLVSYVIYLANSAISKTTATPLDTSETP